MQIFQKKILELRKLYKYTQKFMAQLLKISQPSYARYENGTAEPSQDTLITLADIFDVSIDYLLGRKDI